LGCIQERGENVRDYSIVFASFNRPKSLERGLKSITDSQYTFSSKVVVDDCSEPANLDYIKHACKEHGFTLITKVRNICLSHSWNLGLIFSKSRYVIKNVDDISYKNKDDWLQYFEDGFDKGFYKVRLYKSSAYGFDKTLITRVGWFDEGYQNALAEDTDYELRMNLVLFGGIVAPPKSYLPNVFNEPFDEYGNSCILHKTEAGESRPWTNTQYINHAYFFKKWKVPFEKIYELNPSLKNALSSERGRGWEIVNYAEYYCLVDKDVKEKIIYPEITEQYANGNYGLVEGFQDDRIKEIIIS
jgi:glycosyltransferase involved in cell wall biosynthesis